MLRSAIDDPQRRARFSAVYGIIGFVSVPLTYFSTKWFSTIHPDLGQTPGFGMTPPMRLTMFVGLAAFTLVYIVLMIIRTRVERSSDEVAQLKQEIINR